MDQSLKKSRRQMQQQKNQAKSRRKSSTVDKTADMAVATAAVAAKDAQGGTVVDPDSGELSPKSRRRYQSRKSSARLRERQRQRIHDAEEEVSRLEGYVRALQQTIEMHKNGHSAKHISGKGTDDMNDGPVQQIAVQWGDDEARRNFNARVRQLV
ncbi:hypothetical protein J3B02_005137, partial [Coemansia erecta]